MIQTLWEGDLEKFMPTQFSPAYVPVERWLPPEELALLMKALPVHRVAVVAFSAATSAEWGCVERARREDLALDETDGSVQLRGTKNKLRWRKVPVVTEDQRALLDFVREHADGTDGLLFSAWSNVPRDLHDACRRDLHDACDRAKIPHCSPNDLRRTCGRWLRKAGVHPQLIAPRWATPTAGWSSASTAGSCRTNSAASSRSRPGSPRPRTRRARPNPTRNPLRSAAIARSPSPPRPHQRTQATVTHTSRTHATRWE